MPEKGAFAGGTPGATFSGGLFPLPYTDEDWLAVVPTLPDGAPLDVRELMQANIRHIQHRQVVGHKERVELRCLQRLREAPQMRMKAPICLLASGNA